VNIPVGRLRNKREKGEGRGKSFFWCRPTGEREDKGGEKKERGEK